MGKFISSLRERLQPPIVQSAVAGAIAVAAAFGAPVTAAQSASILVFGGAVSTLLLTRQHLSELAPESVIALATAAVGVAVKLGAPITASQGNAVLGLTSVVAFILLGHGVVKTIKTPAPILAGVKVEDVQRLKVAMDALRASVSDPLEVTYSITKAEPAKAPRARRAKAGTSAAARI